MMADECSKAPVRSIDSGRGQRPAAETKAIRERMLDKTLADSFPTSDPPSTIPDPGEDDSFAA
jgi:hypothetical protein